MYRHISADDHAASAPRPFAGARIFEWLNQHLVASRETSAADDAPVPRDPPPLPAAIRGEGMFPVASPFPQWVG